MSGIGYSFSAAEWQQNQDQILGLKAEVNQLRSIVDKLPKTVDGVPVVPGMSLWLPGYKWSGEANCITVNDAADWPGASAENSCRIEQCYSTREVAEAGGE